MQSPKSCEKSLLDEAELLLSAGRLADLRESQKTTSGLESEKLGSLAVSSNLTLLDTLANLASLKSPIKARAHDDSFVLNDDPIIQRRSRAYSEPWDNDDSWANAIKLLGGYRESETGLMIDKYSSIYNKNGRIGVYTREERDSIISRFHQKRQRRVWKKKIRYHCRKNLADRRVRVKGRFVKAAESASKGDRNVRFAVSDNEEEDDEEEEDDGEEEGREETQKSPGEDKEREPRKRNKPPSGRGDKRTAEIKTGLPNPSMRLSTSSQPAMNSYLLLGPAAFGGIEGASLPQLSTDTAFAPPSSDESATTVPSTSSQRRSENHNENLEEDNHNDDDHLRQSVLTDSIKANAKRMRRHSIAY